MDEDCFPDKSPVSGDQLVVSVHSASDLLFCVRRDFRNAYVRLSIRLQILVWFLVWFWFLLFVSPSFPSYT